MNNDVHRTVTCRTREGESKEVRAEELLFRPSVYGVIVREGKVLLVPQWDGYDFPGGGIDKGERIAEALIREVKEETGMDVVPGELLYVDDDFYVRSKNNEVLHSILMFYTCTVTGGTLSDAGFSEFEKEIAKIAEWVPIEKALTVKFYNPVDSPALIRKAARL